MNFETEHKNIFSTNPGSPLFIRVASNYASDGNLDEAIKTLKNGIELFEDYPTPYFLLGEMYLSLGKLEEAKNNFEAGNLLLKNEVTLNFYLSKLDEISSPDPFKVLDQMTKEEFKPLTLQDGKDIIEPTENIVEENLDELADKLKTAKITINNDVKENNSSDENDDDNPQEFKPLKGLVSETLASIYFNQSNYKEAKAIYETLINIQPERENYFRTKIAEIEQKMRPRL